MWDEALEPEQMRSLNAALRKLADNGGGSPDLQDAAKKLLSGRVPLREAMDDPSVARALGGGMASLRGEWESLSEEEREQIVRGGTPAADGPSSDPSSQSRRSDGEPSQPAKKSQARHSGGFSLY
ncbi:hypothetical protein AR457_09525 [Streptomyces agglomeratus]|uniref:Uncharacterized protein n=1 Tax=Streptomyces agglomeratus TaxID=285458 RepID=A0A1E5P5C1_9ACTN|nr:hypothetical protein AS594_09695 [Streptomyces agglomeratus]OEJ41320.1 hypothetical protein BGK70_27140 [Streptomyces agglomeratus]OEJ44306.1 hypothetical protein AR457_09525 [Streptomyces agglomeratus]OEJ53823.1 hypothetical protein BGK72_26500 [Streptomyces agglomeratus]OEJ61188.1 hypothetical protein BGM19_27370 [Streptomyces agglomeratus]